MDEEDDETRYDPEMEMLGMRTENSKTYITDSGTATVYTSEPQHMMNDYGQWVEIDYDIIATDAGYSLTSAPTNVDFGLNVEDGFSIELSEGVLSRFWYGYDDARHESDGNLPQLS